MSILAPEVRYATDEHRLALPDLNGRCGDPLLTHRMSYVSGFGRKQITDVFHPNRFELLGHLRTNRRCVDHRAGQVEIELPCRVGLARIHIELRYGLARIFSEIRIVL